MVDLVIKQVTEGLSSAEQLELDVMDKETVSACLRGFERAAAAVTLTAPTDGAKLPPELAWRVVRQAEQHFANLATVDTTAAAASVPLRAAEPRAAEPRAARSAVYGWLAAAACLVLAVVGWLRTPAPPELPAVAVVKPIPNPVPEPPPSVPPTPAEERAAMLAKSDSIKVTLGATKDPAAKGVSGDAVWDPVTQRGFLHFVGLAANDPAVKQYQMWIFDAARDQRYPIDGGIFNVPADVNEVVIPISASLPVTKAAAFAVTIEKAGGAVVSTRQHIVALGAAS